VIIGGETRNISYSAFQEEMNMFNRAFLEVLSEGDAKGRVFTFPIPTYNISSDFNWEAPGIERLWEVTAKYGIPYFANFTNSDMSPDDARSMCCRLRLDLRKLEKRGGGLFGANPQTGSIGVVTINMPRLGYLASDEKDFLRRLDLLMEKARASLETKRKVLEHFTENDLYPFTKFYLRNVKQRFGKYWQNHFSTIGLLGMNEACMNLYDKNIGSPEGVEFATTVMNHMRERLMEYQQETGNLYNLEATPAEGTTYRLARLDRKLYPEVKSANHQAEETEGAEPFYTNSTQLPVNYSDDIYKVLDLQDEIQTLYTGGTVMHIFLGEAASDPGAVKSFVRKICTNYHLPYFTMTPTFSICPTHGYIRGKETHCPKCGKKTEIYSRVVGYLRPVEQWNEGKQAEFELRKNYSIDKSIDKQAIDKQAM
jgi:anaerobic ribonucleoside-triphosphate reductase